MRIVRDTNSRFAIVTRAQDGYELAPLTHPTILKYAVKCGADFVVLNESVINAGHYSYEILQFYDLFSKYDRILSVDSDVIISPLCPNIFQIVPYDCIASIYEDKHSRKKDRRQRIRLVQEKFGQVGWESGYINTGFFLATKPHKELFKYESDQIWNSYGRDDVYLGYRIHKYGFKVFELPYLYNHMSSFSEIGHNWLKSYVIHYAGRGFSGKKTRFEQITEDLLLLEKRTPLMLNFCHPIARLRLIALGLYQRLVNLKRRGS